MLSGKGASYITAHMASVKRNRRIFTTYEILKRDAYYGRKTK